MAASRKRDNQDQINQRVSTLSGEPRQAAGFEGIDVYWKQLEWVVYAGCRPADVAA
jgi:hypothetical protein